MHDIKYINMTDAMRDKIHQQ